MNKDKFSYNAVFKNRVMVTSSITSNSTGCQMNIVKSAMSVLISLTLLEGGIIVEYVAKFFVIDAAVKKFLEK